jgi:MFS family permease
MIFHFHLPHYFASKVRKQVEHLYSATAIGNLAQAMITLFEPIFLYQALGLSIVEVLLFFATVYALYIILMPFGAKIATTFGYAHSIFFSVPFQILFWLSLIGSQYNFNFIYIAPLLYALQKTLFWPAWNATLAQYANQKQVAREFSMMYALMSVMQILGPMIGGFLAIFLGPTYLFVIGSIIYLCSAIPLFWSKEGKLFTKYRYHDTWALIKKYPARFLGYLGFGEELLVLTIWPIFIFLVVKNYQDVGSLVTVATLLATSLSLYIGIYSDKHSKTKVMRIGNFFYILSWLARIPVIGAFGAFITDSISRTAKGLIVIPLTSLTYERAETTKIMPYIVGSEQMLCMGKILACLLGIIVFAATGSFVLLFLLGGLFSLFYFLI